LRKHPAVISAFGESRKRRKLMLWTIIVILLVLWLLGFFGPAVLPMIPVLGPWVHILIVVVIILVVLDLLGVI
jgi:hypothetical protein